MKRNLSALRLTARLALMGALCIGVASAADTVEHTLSNGLRIIVKPDHRAPVAVSLLWYKVGSIDEVNGTTGVAHVLEHMMFKGTRNIGVGEFSRRIAAAGGRDNAFTSKDYTGYFQTVHESQLGLVLELEAEPDVEPGAESGRVFKGDQGGDGRAALAHGRPAAGHAL